jgi:hypothetical protein
MEYLATMTTQVPKGMPAEATSLSHHPSVPATSD